MSTFRPPVRYAKSSSGHVAYQVIGEGPVDLILLPSMLSHLDLTWDEPSSAFFLRGLASYSRLLIFDRRGTGLSDPPRGAPTPEDVLDDFHAVLNDTGLQSAVIFGASTGGSMAALFAARFPERASALILYGAYAKLLASPDYPQGLSDEAFQRSLALAHDHDSAWPAGGATTRNLRLSEWGIRSFRASASPQVAVESMLMYSRMDIRSELGRITAPTLVLTRTADEVISPAQSHYLAEHIPNSTLVELDGTDHPPFYGDTAAVVQAIQRFLLGTTRLGNRMQQFARGQRASTLTLREEEVVMLFCAGASAKEIAQKLRISQRTVETHIAHVYQKLGVHSRADLQRTLS